MRVRSGSCGGLDLCLTYGTIVNCPIDEPFAALSPYELIVAEDGSLVLTGSTSFMGTVAEVVKPLAEPSYYVRLAASGEPLSRLGQVCSDRLGIGITNRCAYWTTREERCRFCSIGLNGRTEQPRKSVEAIIEVADAAFTDAVAPARHVLIGGGTPNAEEAGVEAIAAAAAAVRERHSERIYAMLAPPRDLARLELLREAGVDEVAINVEVFDENAARLNISAKRRTMSLEHTLAALDYCVALFGPVDTRSILVVGLEPRSSLLEGIGRLAAAGVMPILSPLRPLQGTDVAPSERVCAEILWDLTLEAAAAVERHGVPLGPTCIPCQSNTLTVPGHPSYRYY